MEELQKNGSSHLTVESQITCHIIIFYIFQEEIIPSDEVANFKFAVEIHMGGCGVIEVSSDWSSKSNSRMTADSAALGLKFCKHLVNM